jgi:16S rRNA processing protein RimM
MKLLGVVREIKFDGVILSDIPEDMVELKIPCDIRIGYSESTAKTFGITEYEILKNRLKITALDNMKSFDSAFKIEMGVWIDEASLIFEQSDGFFISDLIGCVVFSYDDKSRLGELTQVLKLPANDVWIIDIDQGELPVPAVDEFVKLVDLKSRRIEIKMMEGLIDLVQKK